jgi:hypothetical protein
MRGGPAHQEHRRELHRRIPAAICVKRTFVDAKCMSNTVRGPVGIRQPSLSERSPGQAIKRGSKRLACKDGSGKGNVAFEDICETITLKLRWFTKMDGSRDICRSIPVLTAAINQVHARLCDHGAIVLLGSASPTSVLAGHQKNH